MNAISSTSVSSFSTSANGAPPSMAKIKEDVQALGKALEAKDADGAKQALATLQKDAPELMKEKSPVSDKVAALSKAVEAGDIDGAKKALSDLKASAPEGKGPRDGKGSHGAGGPPPSGGGAGSKGAAASSSSTKTYDPMDANKDGKVTDAEKAAYYLKHPEAKKAAEATEAKSSGAISDVRQLAAQLAATEADGAESVE